MRDHRVQQQAQPGSIIAGGWPSTRAWSVQTGGASEWARPTIALTSLRFGSNRIPRHCKECSLPSGAPGSVLARWTRWWFSIPAGGASRSGS